MAARAYSAGLSIALLLAAGSVFADEPATEIMRSPVSPPPPPSLIRHAATWPATLHLTALVGASLGNPGLGTPDRTPVAFGAVAELLWRGRVGGFAGLLSTSGLAVPPVGSDSAAPDRISVPFGVALRPFTTGMRDRHDYLARFAMGIVLQTGVSVENVRSSDQNRTVAAFHLAAGFDVPLWGSVTEGGVAIRVYARGIFGPEVHLHAGETRELFTPNATGQVLVGFCYTP